MKTFLGTLILKSCSRFSVNNHQSPRTNPKTVTACLSTSQPESSRGETTGGLGVARVQSFNYLQDEHCNPPFAPGKDAIGQTQQTINLLQNKAANLCKASWATKKQFHREAYNLFCCSGTITLLMLGHSFQAPIPKLLSSQLRLVLHSHPAPSRAAPMSPEGLSAAEPALSYSVHRHSMRKPYYLKPSYKEQDAKSKCHCLQVGAGPGSAEEPAATSVPTQPLPQTFSSTK